jgi:hypothetical protein
MPVATATADPPEEPAGLSAGFQGLSGLGEHDGTGGLEPAHHLGVLLGDMILVERRAEGCPDAGRQGDVLDPDGKAGQWPDRFAAHDGGLDRAGLLPCRFDDERHDRVELRIDSRDHRKVRIQRLDRTDGARGDQRCKLARRFPRQAFVGRHLPDQWTKRRSVIRNRRLSP